MRTVVFMLAATALSNPASAQSWQEYNYPEYAFTVAFPAKPQVETTTYQAATGRAVPAHVYSVRQNNDLFKVTVAEMAATGLDEKAVLDHAIQLLSGGGKVTFNIPQRIYSVYGRSLGVEGGDGSRSTIAVFDYHGRLYQIEAKALIGQSGSAESFGSSNPWCSPMAARTVLRTSSGHITRLVLAWPSTPRALTTHAARTHGLEARSRRVMRCVQTKMISGARIEPITLRKRKGRRRILAARFGPS